MAPPTASAAAATFSAVVRDAEKLHVVDEAELADLRAADAALGRYGGGLDRACAGVAHGLVDALAQMAERAHKKLVKIQNAGLFTFTRGTKRTVGPATRGACAAARALLDALVAEAEAHRRREPPAQQLPQAEPVPLPPVTPVVQPVQPVSPPPQPEPEPEPEPAPRRVPQPQPQQPPPPRPSPPPPSWAPPPAVVRAAVEADMRQAATAGNWEAQRDLALMLEEEEEGGEAEAAVWYARAAEAGCPTSANNLGSMYWRGDIVPRDPQRAATLFQQAVSAGSVSACNNLGVCYEDGDGVERDMTRATELYAKAAGAGHPGATLNLAYARVREGRVREAADLYATCSERDGSTEATHCLAHITEYAECSHELGGLDAAIALYRRAAEGGNARSQHRLAAYLYDNGDARNALMWYHRAASGRDADALNALGVIAEHGLCGTAPDPELALQMYRRAAAEGSVDAEDNIVSLEEALCRRALDSGFIEAPPAAPLPSLGAV